MNPNTDYLLGLYRMCEGNIRIDINHHRSLYDKADEYLRKKKFAGKLSAAVHKECVGRDQVIEIEFLPNRKGDPITMVGSDLREVLCRAVGEAKDLLCLEHLIWLEAEHDCTTNLEQLIRKCKASVHLDINEFKEKEFWDFDAQKYTSDGTAKIYLNNLTIERPDVFDKDEEGGYEIAPTSRTIMEGQNTVLRLRWYDRTPVAFNNLFDVDLPRMLAFANQETT